MSNLRTNTVRSLLGEYLVAKAVNAPSSQRIEWDSFDVEIPEGRIEVKTSAYLQAWEQQKPSTVVFSGLRAKSWTPVAGYSESADYNADAYVFAVITATTHDLYQALDTSQWRFWILPRQVVVNNGYNSMRLSTVMRLADGWMEGSAACEFADLGPIVLRALKHTESGVPTRS